MLISALLVVHVILVMTGYVGLVACNAWLLFLCRAAEAQTLLRSVGAWRTLARAFGPALGIGMLAGFALAAEMRMPLTALWLLLTYVLVVLAIGAQAAFMVPWQLRAEAAIARGETLSARPIVTVLSVLTLAYVAIASLMLLRPA